MSLPNTPLPYAPRPLPPKPWLGPLLRKLRIPLLILAILIGCKLLIPPLYRQMVRYSSQLHLESSSPTPGTVLYTDDPAPIQNLVAQGTYQRETTWSPFPYVTRNPVPISDFDFVGRFTTRTFSGSHIGTFRADQKPTRSVFIGTFPEFNFRQSPDGPSLKHIAISYEVASRATLAPRSQNKRITYNYAILELLSSDTLTLLAPIPDPQSTSSFILPYTLNHTPGEIHAQLLSDDALTLRFSFGPACTRPIQNFSSTK